MIGTQWRLLLTPGTGGKSKLWDWSLDAVKLPPPMTRWTSQGQGFGYRGWKFCFQFWADYICAGAVNVTLTSDTGTYTLVLPPGGSGVARVVERRLLPSPWGAGKNKSKLYSVDIVAADPTKPFMMFPDQSGIEWIACGADRHTAFQQATLSSFMEVPI
jgi:hypothetical protein